MLTLLITTECYSAHVILSLAVRHVSEIVYF